MFKRINKFFNTQISNDQFWQEWYNHREDYKEATIFYKTCNSYSKDLVEIAGDISDRTVFVYK